MTAFSIGGVRARVFNKEFMSKFEKDHEAIGSKPAVGGLPDDGNGYYGRHLDYKSWYDMNNAVRAHMNFLETFLPIVALLMIGAVNKPEITGISSLVVALGRILYAIGYRKGGPKGRIAGAILFDLGLLAAIVAAVWSIIDWPSSSQMRVFPVSGSASDKIIASWA